MVLISYIINVKKCKFLSSAMVSNYTPNSLNFILTPNYHEIWINVNIMIKDLKSVKMNFHHRIFTEYETDFIKHPSWSFPLISWWYCVCLSNTHAILIVVNQNPYYWIIGRNGCNFMFHTRNRPPLPFTVHVLLVLLIVSWKNHLKEKQHWHRNTKIGFL